MSNIYFAKEMRPDDELRRGEQDAMGRYILEGPATCWQFPASSLMDP